MRPYTRAMRQFSDTPVRFDRGLLRPLAERDLGDVKAACNDEAIRSWLPLPVPYTEDDARFFALEHAPRHLASGAGIEWAIESEGRLCGVVGLKDTDWSVGSTEVGYWLAPWGRGRGLMTTAVRTVTDRAFADGMQRVELRVATGNLASLSVALRADFRFEGTLRRAGRTHGGLVDLLILSRLADDLA